MWASRGGAALNLLFLTLICGKWGGYNCPSFSFSVNQLRRTLFILRFFRGDGVSRFSFGDSFSREVPDDKFVSSAEARKSNCLW